MPRYGFRSDFSRIKVTRIYTPKSLTTFRGPRVGSRKRAIYHKWIVLQDWLLFRQSGRTHLPKERFANRVFKIILDGKDTTYGLCGQAADR